MNMLFQILYNPAQRKFAAQKQLLHVISGCVFAQGSLEEEPPSLFFIRTRERYVVVSALLHASINGIERGPMILMADYEERPDLFAGCQFPVRSS